MEEKEGGGGGKRKREEPPETETSTEEPPAPVKRRPRSYSPFSPRSLTETEICFYTVRGILTWLGLRSKAK